MKTKYKILIGILIVIALASARSIYLSPSGKSSNIGNAIQSAGIFVALLASVIALAVADPKKKSVKINKIEPYTTTAKILDYPQNSLSGDSQKAFQKYADPIKAHQVFFKIANQSGFTLKKPVLTFRLPASKRHPADKPKSKTINYHFDITFNSNLFNYQRDLVTLAFEDIVILSNNILPYWNDNDTVKMWIRMFIDDGKFDPFIVEVSLNCENAEGVTQQVQIHPKKLLDQLATTPAQNSQ